MSECPICMEVIEEDVNTTITACKHKFHTVCLLTNISKNGYSCPNCRGSLIPTPAISDVERGASWYIDTSGNYYVDESEEVDILGIVRREQPQTVSELIGIVNREMSNALSHINADIISSEATILTLIPSSVDMSTDFDSDSDSESFPDINFDFGSAD